MMNKRCIYLSIFLYLSYFTLVGQGPVNGFMPQRGQLDIAYTYSQERYDAFLNATGNPESRSLSARSNSLFLEYGADDNKLNMVMPVKEIEVQKYENMSNRVS